MSAALLFVLPQPMARDLLGVVMTLIGAAYYGFAFSEDDKRVGAIEVVVATGFVLVALLGLWASLWFIVAGLLLHGLWDLLHHRMALARIPDWYIPFCVCYDWIAGLLVAVWLLQI